MLLKHISIVFGLLVLFETCTKAQTLADLHSHNCNLQEENSEFIIPMEIKYSLNSIYKSERGLRDPGERFIEPIVRIGLPLLAGIELMFLRPGYNKKGYYISAAFESIVLINKLSFGGSVFLPKSGFAVGVRANIIQAFVLIDNANTVNYGTGFTLDYIFTTESGLRMDFRIETILIDNSTVYPSFSIGFFDVFQKGE